MAVAAAGADTSAAARTAVSKPPNEEVATPEAERSGEAMHASGERDMSGLTGLSLDAAD